MCGNHILDLIRTVSIRGSPPRVREPPRVFRMKARIARITPACAGTTGSGWPCTRSPRDHPRVCGNHSASNSSRSSISGSPPRAREPLLLQFVQILNFGITPACAGTTAHTSSIRTTARDHPRVCGNHCNRVSAYAFTSGSPPRVREPRRHVECNAVILGITPACAGTTVLIALRIEILEDHPRVCGNHTSTRPTISAGRGSPPRVREPPPRRLPTYG